MWWAIAGIVAIFMLLGGAGMVVRLVEGRRQYLLDLRREERRIAEAKAKESQLRQKRAELEYREAVLELERFDRRTGGPGLSQPRIDPSAEPPFNPPGGPPPPSGPSSNRTDPTGSDDEGPSFSSG